jgi:hypothetical protein
MSKRMRTVALTAALLAVAGCLDLDEVPSDFVAPENFYRNQGDAIAAVNSVYASFINLPDPFSENDYVGREFWMLVEYPTEYVTTRLSAANERSLMGNFNTQFSSSHNYIAHVWAAAYAGINRANAVIARVPAVEMDATRRDQIVGEAKFLRALHYYWLAGLFGALPLKLDETTTIEGGTLPRASAAETWEQIATDLTEAATVLPVSWPSSDFGRATKGAALTLLGKSYMQSAATVPELSGNYQKALTTFQQVVALGYGLAGDYGSLFDGSNETSNEIIFSFQNIRVAGLGGRMTEWFSPITAPQVWPAGGQNQFQAERPFYESYDSADVRKAATWMTSFTNAGKTNTWSWTAGIQTSANYGSTGPTPRKYVDWASPDAGYDGIDYVILRYADVLLSMAEAINEISGPTAEAYGFVDQVRARAGLGPLTPGLSQAAFRDAVFLERKYEFVLELHGVFDMRRHWEWNKARLEANKALRSTLNKSPFTSSVEKFVDTTPILDKWQLYPIPAHAIELNPAMQGQQNPGW